MYIAPLHYHKEESTKSVALGTPYRQASTDRSWRYALNGAVALGAGKVNVSPATVGNHENLSFQTAPAVGDTEVKVTLGGTAVTANQYADGWVTIQDGTGEGHTHPLAGSNDAFSASATATFQLGHGEQILEAGAVSETNVDLTRNPYAGVIIPADTNQNDVVAGIANIDVTASYYFMIQTWGPCAVWQDEAAANLGEPVTFGAATAGQVEGADAATELVFAWGGPHEGVADEYQLTFLRIQP